VLSSIYKTRKVITRRVEERKEGNTMNCKACQSVLPDLLFDATAPSNGAAAEITAARAHLATCVACAEELASLEATFALLDTWHAPVVSPYFDQKLAVRLREEQAAPPASWLERLKTYLLLNTGRQFRPAIAAALALVLVVGGGSFGIATYPHAQPVQASAAVNDLQILDKNEQALQQMDQLLTDDASSDDTNSATPPQS
jgi:anti-sigma factor RsiW